MITAHLKQMQFDFRMCDVHSCGCHDAVRHDKAAPRKLQMEIVCSNSQSCTLEHGRILCHMHVDSKASDDEVILSSHDKQ